MSKRLKNLLIQTALATAVLFLGFWAVKNALNNLEAQGIAKGFGFLNESAGFQILQTLIPYSEASSYLQVFYVGLLNTALVSVMGIAFATILGFALGVALFQDYPLTRLLSHIYIGTIRNVPLLLQIFFWYFAVLQNLPEPRESLNLGSFFVNNRGFYFPWLVDGHWQHPVLEGFGFVGGSVIFPELIALVLGLVFYTSAFIAELVCASLKSVGQGMWEVSFSLGLSKTQTFRYVIFPQAFRVLIPPLSSQFMNLIKNSSLATAIGYPDLVAVFAGTALNQTGQAIEIIGMTMAVYLVVNLLISGFMNYANFLVLRKERS